VGNNSKQQVLVGQIRRQVDETGQDATGWDKDCEGRCRLRESDGKNLRQANRSRDEAVGMREGQAKEADWKRRKKKDKNKNGRVFFVGWK
jgi:hypothetical protein